MSAKLFHEPQKSDRPERRTIRNIDDLILDAELEAQAEIDRKLRVTNTKMLLLVLVGVGVLYGLVNKPEGLSIDIPSFMDMETQIAEAPPAPGPTPKPIPFPVADTSSVPEVTETPATTVPEPDATVAKDLNPLENEVLAMIQHNLETAEPATPQASEDATRPVLTKEPKSPIVSSPFAPDRHTPEAPVTPSVTAQLSPKADSAPKASTPSTKAPLLTAAQSRYFIQVGAFSVKANADRVIKRLMTGGFSPLVQTRTSRTSMHVVFIGGFADDVSPRNMITSLREKGLNPVLKKNDNGSYSIILGKNKSRAQAEALKGDLTRKGIFTSLKQMKVNSRMYIVRVGNFDSNTKAAKNQKKIEGLGYKGTLIRKKS